MKLKNEMNVSACNLVQMDPYLICLLWPEVFCRDM
jgi:hypothetical protein